MADNLDDGEFWLPPQFLSDDDAAAPFQGSSFSTSAALYRRNGGDAVDAGPRALFPYLSIPVESSETESDEEEHLAELTRQIARCSTLEVDLSNQHSSAAEKPKVTAASGSPQSTLSAFGSSGKGSSPNDGVYQGNSQKATWDLLRAAAGEVERMRLREEGCGFVKPSPGVRLYPHSQQQSLSPHQQLQVAKFEMLRQQQMAKQQQQQHQGSVWGCGVQGRSDQMVPNRGRNNVRGGGVMGLSSTAWPPLQHAKQQQYGSGMRAVFIGNPSAQKERTGTGVFLPRVNTPAEARKKPACSTVLVPDRVAQALNLNLDGMVGGRPQHKHRFNGIPNMENAGSAVPRVQSSYGISQQKRNLRSQPPANYEIQLPQEWTY